MTQVLVVIFLIFMTYMWSHYGVFRAVLHLVTTIVAGSLAIAFWEPLVFQFGFAMKPEYAWGIWLLGPFILYMVALRFLTDKFISLDVDHTLLANAIGGGVCGLCSGILTAGLTVIGLGFLPLDFSFGQYKPLTITQAGHIEDHHRLWPPVDGMTAAFFTRLSGGGFYGGESLSQYMPELARQSWLFRIRADGGEMVTAVRDSIAFGRCLKHSMPLDATKFDQGVIDGLQKAMAIKGLDEIQAKQLVIVETTVYFKVPPFDSDRILRLAVPQVRLFAKSGMGRQVRMNMHFPVAFVETDINGHPWFEPIDSLRDGLVSANTKPQIIRWVYVLPDGEAPSYMLVRQLRLKLPPVAEYQDEPRIVKQALGKIKPPKKTTKKSSRKRQSSKLTKQSGKKATKKPKEIEVTDELYTLINIEKADTFLTFTEQKMHFGKGEVRLPRGRVPKHLKCHRVYAPPGQVAVRVRLAEQRLHTLLGRARALAASLGPIWITDHQGDQHFPIGYVWVKQGKTLVFHFEEFGEIRYARQLPQNPGENDIVHLYFSVPSGVKIVSYQLDQDIYTLDTPLEIRQEE